MSEIKYTIIIPHYNIPKLLVRLINSIPDREDIQVIIADDDSLESETYLQRYPQLKKSNIEFYICKKNGGGGYARNEGLKYARGKWLLFADADDIFVENFDSILDKNYLSDEDIIYFQVKSVYSDKLSNEASRHIYKDKIYNDYLQTHDDKILRYQSVEPWAKMIKKSIVDHYEIQFDETRVGNDYFFSIQTGYYAKKVKAIPDVIYIVTERKDSISNKGWSDSPDKLLTRLNIAIKAQLFLKNNNVELVPMPIRGLMVLVLKTQPMRFLKILSKLYSQNISIMTLLWQMFSPVYRNKKQ